MVPTSYASICLNKYSAALIARIQALTTAESVPGDAHGPVQAIKLELIVSSNNKSIPNSGNIAGGLAELDERLTVSLLNAGSI
jgi:hypothetical protein